jgi:Heparinase II/III-like protein/Heparinase II/III N-terminus
MVAVYFKILKSIRLYGWIGFMSIVLRRVFNRVEESYWRYRFKHKWVASLWSHKMQHAKVSCLVFKLPESMTYFCTYNKCALIERASTYRGRRFKILGSEEFEVIQGEWQRDWKVASSFISDVFYKDISLSPVSYSVTLEKDIKVPWQLCRFQHFFILGMAYTLTDQYVYVDAFKEQVCDWITSNPYMSGIHWLSPMEVALRAINWVWALHFFAHLLEEDPLFYRTVTASLYDHMRYLHSNWELYDGRTNNHYLSNLVGYLYLCWFFKHLFWVRSRCTHIIAVIWQELERQIFQEGSCYEGSTAYHKLVTELVRHIFFICDELSIEIPQRYRQKYKKMGTFLQYCIPHGGSLVLIGDNDSGSVLTGVEDLVYDRDTMQSVCYFEDFGISIIKTDRIHVTLRHHSYHKRQPTGHFHNDALSMTLTIDGIPVIVDPGTYVYTASGYWRNYFRSVEVHNTFFIEGQEPVPWDTRLFALDLPENAIKERPLERGDGIVTLRACHNLYQRYEKRAGRELVYDGAMHTITLIDSLINSGVAQNIVSVCWNFTLGPDIEVFYRDLSWYLCYKGRILVKGVSSSLCFVSRDGWYAPEYGSKYKVMRMFASSVGVVHHHTLELQVCL